MCDRDRHSLSSIRNLLKLALLSLFSAPSSGELPSSSLPHLHRFLMLSAGSLTCPYSHLSGRKRKFDVDHSPPHLLFLSLFSTIFPGPLMFSTRLLVHTVNIESIGSVSTATLFSLTSQAVGFQYEDFVHRLAGFSPDQTSLWGSCRLRNLSLRATLCVFL